MPECGGTEKKMHLHKEDLRVRKTKKALNDAFINMMSEKTFEEITINELCDRAGVRRATFYKHYADKFAFLTAFTRSLREKFDAGRPASEKYESASAYYVAYAKRLVEYVAEHDAFVDNLMKSDLLPIVLAIMVVTNYEDTKSRLQDSVENGMTLVASSSTVSAMCVGGVAAALYLWVAEGRKKSIDVLAEEIGAVIAASISEK